MKYQYEVNFNHESGEWYVQRLVHMSLPEYIGSYETEESAKQDCEKLNSNTTRERRRSERMKRPILRYFGGKYILAPWIIEHFPKHKVYVEPYGGAASVLMQKPRAYAEVWNDLDDSVFSLFQVLRTFEGSMDLKSVLEMTPYSRREFELAHVFHPDPVENARRLIIRSFMGFGADSVTNINSKTGFRRNSNRSGTTPAHDWLNYPKALTDFTERLKGVIIENKNALEVMGDHDSDNTLHYIDPPYPTDIRKGGRYKHEMTLAEHIELRDFVKTLKGSVVISGYDHEIYNELDWRKVTKNAYADGAAKRVECLWIK